MWAHFPQIQQNFGDIYTTWKAKRETFGAGFYLYLATRRGMRLYPEHRFTNLIWGIEALHRKMHPELREATSVTKKIRRIIDEVTKKSDKTWLQRQLRYAGEPNLEQRIFEMFGN